MHSALQNPTSIIARVRKRCQWYNLFMISCLLISQDISQREAEIEKILANLELSKNHSNVLWFAEEEKLGIGEARKIQEFLSLKPYQGKAQAVVLLASENLSQDAQHALLKTLEEAGENVSIILGSSSEDQLLSTIISRCKVVNLQTQTQLATPGVEAQFQKDQKDIEKLLEANLEERFKFIEKLEDKESFLYALTAYFRQQLPNPIHLSFLKDLIETEKWAKQNVNIRAILEYLMLKMP